MVAFAVAPRQARAQLDTILRGLTGGAGFPGVMVPGIQPPMPPPAYSQPMPNAEPIYNADPRAVTDVQRMLGGLGYDVGSPDGAYGGRTAQALRAFQRDHRLQQTGNITPPTLAAMNGAWQAQGRPLPPQRAVQADMAPAPRPAAEMRQAENAGGPAAGQQPSFNCARASSNAEQLICASPSLARLDADLAEAFRSLRSGLDADEAARLVVTQRAWLKQRDACGRQAACIQDRMAGRLAELEAWPGGAMAQSAPPAGVPDSNAGRVLSSIAPPANPTAASVAQATTSVLERIAAPLAGIRPLALLVREGFPVLSYPDSRDGNAFWQLVALGLQPGLIEERDGYRDTALDFANTFMPPTNPYSRGGQWLGKDEFERGDNRQVFLRDQADALRGMAPRVPFGFVFTTEFNLPQYDPARRGFVLPQWSDVLLAQQMQPGRVTLRPRFNWPEPFLPMEAAAARRLVERLGATPRGRERTVRLAMFLEAAEAEQQGMALSLNLRRAALYDSAIETRLHEFDAGPLRRQSPSGSHPLARLTNPPAGMRPLPIATLDGLPLLDGDEGSRYAGLFGLVAAGAVPGFPANDQIAVQLALNVLNDRVNKELFQSMGGRWAGEDEFARERTRNSFYDRYLPILKAAAPKPPFEFAYAKAGYVGQYDRQKNGFPVGLRSGGQGMDLGLDGEVSAGGLVPAASFAWPEPVWRLDFAAAEKALKALKDRQVRVVGVFEASSLDPATRVLDLRLKSMALYTPDLRTKLFDFPVANDLAPFVSAAIPERLRFAAPTAPDALFACAKLFEAMAEQLPDVTATRCWQTVRARDAEAYNTPERLAGLKPDDARRPFFPRAPVERSAATNAAFARWMKAYAAGLTEAGVAISNHVSRAEPDGTRFYAFGESRASTGSATPAFLQTEALQQDQLAPQAAIDNIPISLVLPNRGSLYSATVPSAALAASRGTALSAVSTVRVGAARQIRSDDGRPMVLVEATPLSTTVSAGATRLASHSYEDVPRLDGKSFVAAAAPMPATEAARAAGPLLLDSALADLLAASALGDQLSPEALTYLVTRRWQYENGEGAATISDGRGGRSRYASAGATSPSAKFFTAGKRRPTPEEAAELGKKFIIWAKAQAPALPVRVVAPGRLEVKKDQRTASWGSLTCFSGGFSAAMAESNASQTAYFDIEACKRNRQRASEGQVSWSQEDEKQCAAAEARQSTLDFLKPMGGACRLGGSSLSFADPATFAMRIPYGLQTPDVPVLGDKRELAFDTTLDITRVELTRERPSVADMLPEAMRRFSDRTAARGPAGQFVTFDAALVETRWRDASGKELARLAPDPASSLTGIVRRYEERARAADAVATPSGPYGPDLIGIQLGMTFEDAERIIRAHMAVGRVLDGQRAHDEAAKLGRVKPLTSGRLFISEDGRELIALLDDAPSAPGRVLAAWRRLYLPPDSVELADVLAGLGKKYGPPSGRSSLRIGMQMPWFGVKGGGCTSMYAGLSNVPLTETWHEDGTTAAYRSENAAIPKGPSLPTTLFDPLSDRNRQWMECGPFLTATLNEARHMGGVLNELEMTLTDIGPYAAAFAKSRQLLQAAAASQPTAPPPGYGQPYGPDMVGVQLGMGLPEAEVMIRKHMSVGRVLRAARGSARLFMSEDERELIAILDEPDAAPGRVVAAWRQLYAPVSASFEVITSRMRDKYGEPYGGDDMAAPTFWGPMGNNAGCIAAYTAAIRTRSRLQDAWLDEGAPLRWRAKNGEDEPNSANLLANRVAAPVTGCGPWVGMMFTPAAGEPAMNLIETTLSDLTRPPRTPPPQARVGAPAVKF